jgi:hypothetical protein
MTTPAIMTPIPISLFAESATLSTPNKQLRCRNIIPDPCFRKINFDAALAGLT